MIPYIGFNILDTYDTKTIRVEDDSRWEHLVDEDSFLDVNIPGRKAVTTLKFTKYAINKLNSQNLEITSGSELKDLPDGIYCIELYLCDRNKFSYKRSYLRTVKLLLRLDQLLIDSQLGCCNKDKNALNKYLEIELLIKGAHAELRDGNLESASCMYEKSLELVDEFEKCYKEQNGKC